MKAKLLLWSWIASFPLLFIGAALVDVVPAVGYATIGLFFAVNLVFIVFQHHPDVEREADKISQKFN